MIFNLKYLASTFDALHTSVSGDTTSGVLARSFMKQSKFVPIKGETKYFAHISGYIFYELNGIKIIIPPIRISKRNVIVDIKTKTYNLVKLLIESFGIEYYETDKLKYTITKEGYIPVNSIITTPIVNRLIGISDKD